MLKDNPQTASATPLQQPVYYTVSPVSCNQLQSKPWACGELRSHLFLAQNPVSIVVGLVTWIFALWKMRNIASQSKSSQCLKHFTPQSFHILLTFFFLYFCVICLILWL